MVRRTLAVVFLSLVLPTAVAHSDIFVPGGLGEGDKYHLAFVTIGTRDAGSPDIADYNAFVQSQAELTGADTEDFGIEWFAIGSTASRHARDNAPVSAPVYLLDSTLISTAGPTIYDDTLASALNIDQFTDEQSGINVWTGSNPDGTGFTGQTLGTSFSRYGKSSVTASGWINWNGFDTGSSLHIYALSEQLTVAPVPEPTGFAMLAGLTAMGLGWCRRRRDR